MDVGDHVHATWRSLPDERGYVELDYAAISVTGAGRSVNEDSWLAAPPVFLVADGMGGHRAGDQASAIVAEQFAGLAQSEVLDIVAVRHCLAQCQERVFALAEGSGPGPGSTLISAALVERDGARYWLLANVGDSRAYRWSNGRLEQLSHDHSVVQELMDAGELQPFAARTHPERNVITRAIGIQDAFEADYSLIPVAKQSTLVLCSDGITTEVDDDLIGRICEAEPAPADLARALVQASVAAGHKDDATVVVVRVIDVGIAAELGTSGVTASPDSDTVPHGFIR